MKESSDKNPKYDRKRSTFYSITVFEDGNIMQGYSLKFGYTEPKDPGTCLLNFVLRLMDQGYLRNGLFHTTTGRVIDPVMKIELYNNETNELVYTFFPSRPEPEMLYGWSLNFIEKIDKMYDDINMSMPFEDVYKKYYVSRVRKEKPMYDLSIPRFYSQSALNEYAKVLIKDKGEEPGLVEKYKRQYSEKFFKDGKLDPIILKQLQQQSNRRNYGRGLN